MPLTEPGAVVVDEQELTRLGLKHGVGDTAEIMGHKVRVVGLVRGFKSIWGPYVFCSMQTARMVLPMYLPDQAQYLLASCRDKTDAPVVVERCARKYPEMAVATRTEFSRQTRLYWLTQTRVGLALGLTSVLALIVGLVITSQTLYAATAASLREYAVLRAWAFRAGASRRWCWRNRSGSVWPGWPPRFRRRWCCASGRQHWSRSSLPVWLLAGTIIITMCIALVSGLLALAPCVW